MASFQTYTEKSLPQKSINNVCPSWNPTMDLVLFEFKENISLYRLNGQKVCSLSKKLKKSSNSSSFPVLTAVAWHSSGRILSIALSDFVYALLDVNTAKFTHKIDLSLTDLKTNINSTSPLIHSFLSSLISTYSDSIKPIKNKRASNTSLTENLSENLSENVNKSESTTRTNTSGNAESIKNLKDSTFQTDQIIENITKSTAKIMIESKNEKHNEHLFKNITKHKTNNITNILIDNETNKNIETTQDGLREDTEILTESKDTIQAEKGTEINHKNTLKTDNRNRFQIKYGFTSNNEIKFKFKDRVRIRIKRNVEKRNKAKIKKNLKMKFKNRIKKMIEIETKKKEIKRKEKEDWKRKVKEKETEKAIEKEKNENKNENKNASKKTDIKTKNVKDEIKNKEKKIDMGKQKRYKERKKEKETELANENMNTKTLKSEYQCRKEKERKQEGNKPVPDNIFDEKLKKKKKYKVHITVNDSFKNKDSHSPPAQITSMSWLLQNSQDTSYKAILNNLTEVNIIDKMPHLPPIPSSVSPDSVYTSPIMLESILYPNNEILNRNYNQLDIIVMLTDKPYFRLAIYGLFFIDHIFITSYSPFFDQNVYKKIKDINTKKDQKENSLDRAVPEKSIPGEQVETKKDQSKRSQIENIQHKKIPEKKSNSDNIRETVEKDKDLDYKIISHDASSELIYHAFLTEHYHSSSSTSSLQYTPAYFKFLTNSNSNLPLVISSAIRLQSFLAYLGEVLLVIKSEGDNILNSMKSFSSSLHSLTKGEMYPNAESALYDLMVTGYPIPELKTWFTTIFTDKGITKWKKQYNTSTQAIKKLLIDHSIPACERAIIILSGLKGVAVWKQRNYLSSLNEEMITTCRDLFISILTTSFNLLEELENEESAFEFFVEFLLYQYKAISSTEETESLDTEYEKLNLRKVNEFLLNYFDNLVVEKYVAIDDKRSLMIPLIKLQTSCVRVFKKFSASIKSEIFFGTPIKLFSDVQNTKAIMKVIEHSDSSYAYILVHLKDSQYLYIFRIMLECKSDGREAFMHKSVLEGTRLIIKDNEFESKSDSVSGKNEEIDIIDIKFADNEKILLLYQLTNGYDSKLVSFTFKNLVYESVAIDKGFDDDNASLEKFWFDNLPFADMSPLQIKAFPEKFHPESIAINGNEGRRVICVVSKDGHRYMILDLDEGDEDEENEDEEDEEDNEDYNDMNENDIVNENFKEGPFGISKKSEQLD